METHSTELETKTYRKLRVAYFTHYSELYGANRSLLEMLQSLRKYPIEPIVITPVCGEINKELTKLNIQNKVFYFRTWIYSVNDNFLKKTIKILVSRIVNYFSKIKICKYLQQQNVDLIHTNSSVICIGAMVADTMKISHIWHIREYGEEDYNVCFMNNFERAVQFMVNKSEKIIFISQDLMKKYLPYFNRYDKNMVVYNGADKNKYYQEAHIGKNKKIFNIVCCGLIHPNKNQLEIVHAIDILVNKQKITNIKLLFIGNGDKHYIRQLHKYIDAHNLQEYIEFVGYVKNINDWLQQCDIGIVPSIKEAFGRVTIEYMMAGVAVIGSNSGANPEIIDNGETGYIYELNNPFELSEKIKLFYNNRDQLSIISQNAQKKALNYFSSDVNAEKIYQIYKRTFKCPFG